MVHPQVMSVKQDKTVPFFFLKGKNTMYTCTDVQEASVPSVTQWCFSQKPVMVKDSLTPRGHYVGAGSRQEYFLGSMLHFKIITWSAFSEAGLE